MFKKESSIVNRQGRSPIVKAFWPEPQASRRFAAFSDSLRFWRPLDHRARSSEHRGMGRSPFSLSSAVLATSALWTSGAPAQPASADLRAPAQEQFICHLPGASDRRIGIYRADGAQRCRVDYTRDGRTRSLWSSGHQYQFCVRKALEIVKLLESVHFTCAPHAKAG